MPPPPPPPPPPPMPMGGGPPPPPPMPGKGLPSKAPAGNRGALLSDITKGKQLKKAVTNDRSAPIVGKVSGSSGSAPVGGAPPVPGLAVPGNNRARSNSDQGSRDTGAVTGMEQPPQLAGLFAGGMPKLKKRGGIDTGANHDSSYTSDPESSGTSAPRPPTMAAPKPPGSIPPSRPEPPRPEPHSSASTSAFIPSVANLRKTAGSGMPRPASSASMKGPPPPIGKKPPIAPPAFRKPSQVPPPPPSSAPPPPAAPPPPPIAVNRQPPPPPAPSPNTNGGSLNLAMQAAIRAAGQASQAPPPPPMSPPPPNPSYRAPPAPSSAPPPPSPAPPPPMSPPSNPTHRAPPNPSSAPPLPVSAPPPPISRQQTQQPIRSMLDPSSYTLSSNGTLPKSPSPNRNPEPTRGQKMVINDSRWKFQDESILPKPRDFIGGQKKYRAGRGSSVPLDLSSLQ